MDSSKLSEFKHLFEQFKQTKEYSLRREQSAFASIAKKIIAETLLNEPFKNEFLTGFIQIFKFKTSNENFDKYLSKNIPDKKTFEELRKEAYRVDQWGYTATGLGSIKSLTSKQLIDVKNFLHNAFHITTVEEAKKLTDGFDELDIPLVKSGVYSPWLHYINPEIFPITNNSHKTFLDWIGIDKKYSSCILAFNELKKLTGEDHLAMLDSYTHTFQLENESSTINKLAEELKKRFQNIWRCADSNRWDEIKGSNLLSFNWLNKEVDYKKINLDAPEAGYRAIRPWVTSLKKNDLIFIMGKNFYHGICIAQSEYSYDGPFLNFSGAGPKPAINVQYLHSLAKPSELDFEPHHNPTTFAPIDSYNFGLNRVLKFLFNKERGAFTALQNLIYESEKNRTMSTQPKNIILFGPPGTGKTYNSIDKSVEIVTGKKNSHSENKKLFDDFRRKGQIEFVTFHQNYSYEDFMVGLKPDAEYEQLRFKPYKGIFYEMVKRAKENYITAKESRSKEKEFDTVFNEVVRPVTEGFEVEIRMKSGISYWIYDITGSSVKFRKKGGSTDHTLSIDTLKELVDNLKETPSGLESYYTPLVNLIKEKKKESTGITIEERKNYVLIIDEINRANISRVFGELITLLEEDKRIGEPNEIRVTLPNGERDFGIPPNLYIIGTMNTADKSIALVDIALRRRFEFIGYYPDYGLPELSSDSNAILRHINKAIYNKKKSSDFLIGHAYFLNNSSIETVLHNKIIPLLMEYFSGKSEIVSEVFAETEWNVKYSDETFRWVIQKVAK